jgi:peptidoglycan/xylan/chitin deacetylase (PgdA/CDA1 family)
MWFHLLFSFLFSSGIVHSAPLHSSQSLVQVLDLYGRLYLRAEHAQKILDQEIEETNSPGILFRSEAYKDLLALRPMLEKQAHLLEDLLLADNRQEQKSSLKLWMDTTRDLSKLERLTAQDALDRAKEHGTLAHISPLMSDQKWLTQWEQSEELVSASIKKVLKDSEISRLVKDSRLSLNVDSLSPISPKFIQPSPGPDGNITGYSFPAHTWAVTYDDGPHLQNTTSILQKLEKFGVKATFFWLAENVLRLPDLVLKTREQGHPIKNHSYSHANLPELTDEELRTEIVTSTEVQEPIFGERPQFFRCPYGAGLNDPRVRQLIADTNMVHVFWNVDSLDWKDRRPASILRRVKRLMNSEKRGVILFHDIHSRTAQVTNDFFQFWLSRKGKPDEPRWVTIPEIIKELNDKPEPPKTEPPTPEDNKKKTND